MSQEYLGIKIDYARDSLFDEYGLRRLHDSYMREDETSPQQRLAYVSSQFATNTDHAQRLYDYASKHWLSYSTPILSYGKNNRGLPISCFLSPLHDSAESLVDTMSEVAWLSMLGGGVGIGFGIRSEDDKSVGVMPHMKTYEAMSMAYRQGKTRRGSFASYLDISHPNIIQFVEMRKPTGDQNMRCLELHHGVNITDDFMHIIEKCMVDPNADDTWELRDPGSDIVKGTVSAKWLWEMILDTRMRTGEPYIHWIDTSNRLMPEHSKQLGLVVSQSNICTEITTALDPMNHNRTGVCCLSSLNLEYWDDWKDDKQFYRDVAEMLDNVLDAFIEKAPRQVERAVYSAKHERAIGIGALGFHSLLQKKGIPFESALASSLNHQIFSRYQKYLDEVNFELGAERGECIDGKGTGKRFSLTKSIAPNASSSIILGNTSPSIEPRRGNAFLQDTMSGSFLNKNKFLDQIIMDKCAQDLKLNYEQIWSSIITKAGSVQHLDFLSDYEKDIYKTASEIDQRWIIQHAAERQQYIDQSQSVNLFFKADTGIPYLHHVHYQSWKQGMKTLYYCRSDKLYHGNSMSKKVERVRLEEQFEKTTEEQCLACEG